MKKICFLVVFLIVSYCSFSQSNEDSVKMVVNKMFSAMKLSDQQMLLACFTDSAVLQTAANNKEGKGYVKSQSIAEFAKQISTLPKGAADERISFEMIKIDGILASVWAPYQFYFNGTLSHCGADSFQLVKINGEWKIQYIIDTRRRENCK